MSAIKMPRLAALCALVIASFLAGCAGMSTGEIDNPVLRRATWPDFISAGDIRRACRAGSSDRIRFVLNANRAEQVRIYDLSTADKSLRIRVLTPKVSVNEIKLNNTITRFFNPTDETVRLSERDATLILRAFRDDLAEERAAIPDELLTEWHFWLVGACMDGKFEFDTWLYPEADFLALNFPKPLLRRDISNVAVNQPPVEGRLKRNEYNPKRQQGFDHYVLHLRDDRVILGQNYGQDKTQ